MRLALTHRRLTVLMGMASLLAFAGGAGFEPLSASMAAAGLVLALFWQPSTATAARMERVWLPLAILMVIRALVHVVIVKDDLVIPVVDLLFLLLVAESLRPLDAANDPRLYSLSFALLLASTAYRPGLLFALAFIAYVGLATVALLVGNLRRLGEKHRAGEIPVPKGFLLTTAVLSGFTLLFSSLVFLTFPRVSRGWTGRGEPLATSIAGFADEVSLGSHGSRIFGNPQIVLRVEFPQGVPPDFQSLYWRGRSYDHFDGARWRRSPRIPPSLAPTAWYAGWGHEVVEQRIYAAPLDARILFALHPTLDIEAHSEIQPIFDNVGDLLYWGSAAPSYSVYSIRGRPSPDELRAAEEGFIPARQFYLQLPPLSPEVRSLADSLLGDLPTQYDKARALVDWFQEEFTYTLELPSTPREATLDSFLLERRAGHCEYFSTAMAVLLRSQGILAREVNGFLGGEWSQFGDYLAVTQNQAHAWIEIWFPGYGWVPFDPTPAGTGEGLAETAWFWPGRFLVDALQHRWNKWILDYSIQSQFDILRRAGQFFSRSARPDPSRPAETGRHFPWDALWVLVGGAVFAGAALRASRKRAPVPRSTRLFFRLREAGRRSGVPTEALHSPLAFMRHLDLARHPGAASSRKVVEWYLRDRYSGERLEEQEFRALRGALKAATRALRRKPFR